MASKIVDTRSASLQAFAKALQDRPLDPANPDDKRLYVKKLHVPANSPDPVARLAVQIQRAEGSEFGYSLEISAAEKALNCDAFATS